MVSRRLTGGAACEACRQQEDAAFAAGAGDAAGGEGGGGGVPVDWGYGVPLVVPCSMNRLVKSSRCGNVPPGDDEFGAGFEG